MNRDFNFVKDADGGFISAMELDSSVSEVINIGINFEVSIGYTDEIIAETMGAEQKLKQMKFVCIQKRAG